MLIRLTCMILATMSFFVPRQDLVAAQTLLVKQVNTLLNYGYEKGNWDNFSAELDAAFGAENITVSTTSLDDLPSLLTFDRLIITLRGSNDEPLSALEQANLSAYIATGRRVVLFGEHNTWSEWNSSILAPVGGTYSDGVINDDLTPVLAHPLTSGVDQLEIVADGKADESINGVPLFNENLATLWGTNRNVLSLLSVNVIDDIRGVSPGNLAFANNLANWLAIPEPSSVSLLGFNCVGLLSFARRWRRANVARLEPTTTPKN